MLYISLKHHTSLVLILAPPECGLKVYPFLTLRLTLITRSLIVCLTCMTIGKGCKNSKIPIDTALILLDELSSSPSTLSRLQFARSMHALAMLTHHML